MNTHLKSFTRAALSLAMCLPLVPAAAQAPRERIIRAGKKAPAGSVRHAP